MSERILNETEHRAEYTVEGLSMLMGLSQEARDQMRIGDGDVAEMNHRATIQDTSVVNRAVSTAIVSQEE